MILLDRIETWGADYLEATAVIQDGNLFSDMAGNVPAWAGVEYMAQTIAALAGIRALERGEPVPIGLLLGTREYQAREPHFRRGATITSRIKQVYMDESNLVVFDCTIHSDRLLAQAQIKAIQPDNIDNIYKIS